MSDAEAEALRRLREAPETVQTMVPLRALDEKVHALELRLRKDLMEETQANAIESNDAASRRRFRFALIWLTTLSLLLVVTAGALGAMFAYGSTNRQRLERLERAIDAWGFGG